MHIAGTGDHRRLRKEPVDRLTIPEWISTFLGAQLGHAKNFEHGIDFCNDRRLLCRMREKQSAHAAGEFGFDTDQRHAAVSGAGADRFRENNRHANHEWDGGRSGTAYRDYVECRACGGDNRSRRRHIRSGLGRNAIGRGRAGGARHRLEAGDRDGPHFSGARLSRHCVGYSREAGVADFDGWIGNRLVSLPEATIIAFAYITLDYSLYTQGTIRPIGQERPGQVTPQTLNIYLGKRDTDNPLWWTDWTVTNAQCNLFQAVQTAVAAPSVTSDGLEAFCTVQTNSGSGYTRTNIYSVHPDFSHAPSPLGPPVQMDGYGEDNPYMDVTHGWLYFDAYDLSIQKAGQDIWASESTGGTNFSDPALVSGGLNTEDVEAQPFVYEPTSTLYFASDRPPRDYQYHLSIYKVSINGSSISGEPQIEAQGHVVLARPSISYDGTWFCFTYARQEPGGLNADIAMAKKMQ